jgi:hypothetical protein
MNGLLSAADEGHYPSLPALSLGIQHEHLIFRALVLEEGARHRLS